MKDGIKIAISGKSGCGNSTVSRIVGDLLGLRVINYTFHTMAKEEGIPFEKLCDMAEDDSSWDHLLDKRQIEMTRGGNCVLGSRLAVWLLKDADLSVYLDASIRTRAERIRKREGGSFDSVLEKTRQRDRRDHERYMRLYSIDNDEHDFVDLTINTDTLGPKEIAEIIARRAEQTG
jgi:cytidylate kinase